jgi:exosortase C (VPDSG-CTERM-specific)
LRFGFACLVLSIAFAKPLYDLVRFASKSDIFSYVLLVPVVSFYLAWLKRRELAAQFSSSPSHGRPPFAAVLCLAFGIIALIAFLVIGQRLVLQDRICLSTAAYYVLALAAGFAFLGTSILRVLSFSFFFGVFMVPFPVGVTNAIEIFFQHASAGAASALMHFSGLPVVRDGLFFKLPGLSIQVAQECSGIKSTLVLFITSLLAGHLFLRTPWKRALLALFVVPLAIVRNGFRVWSLAWLTVQVNPDIIDSPLHHRGGPLFFVLSLIPLFLLLLLLRKFDRQAQAHNFGVV